MALAFVAEGGVLLEGSASRPCTPYAARRAAHRARRGARRCRGDRDGRADPQPRAVLREDAALRSYLTSYRVAERRRRGLFISVDAPDALGAHDARRPGHADAPPLLLVGGNGHPVGRAPSTEARVRDLIAWRRRYFPDAELTHRWAAQDYESLDLIPFVGRMPRGLGRMWFATGYAKWGLTNGVAAAIRISEEILGVPWRDRRQWIPVLGTQEHDAADLGRGAAEGARVAGAIAVGWASAERHPAPAEAPAEGEGVVVSRGGVPYGVSTVDGRTCAVRAVCTHLGGVLRWNDAETTWDCPLHGSRFEASGRRIEGPAVHDLPQEPRVPGWI